MYQTNQRTCAKLERLRRRPFAGPFSRDVEHFFERLLVTGVYQRCFFRLSLAQNKHLSEWGNSITSTGNARPKSRHRCASPLDAGRALSPAELHIHPDEEVVHEPDRFRIRQAGVELFSPSRMTTRMDEQLQAMDRAGVDQAVLHVGVWLDWVDIKAARLINDHLAELNSTHPGRIIPLAHVPPLDHDTPRELKRAVIDLGLKALR
jgi:predicted TIM-barrel fold metal-dependent hydrolase